MNKKITVINLTIMVSCLYLVQCIHHQIHTENNAYKFDFQSYMIPHPEKAHRGGEDAYFNSSKMLVVADGVGGWNNRGIDPSKYSRHLCKMSQNLYYGSSSSTYLNQPLEVIKQAQSTNNNVGSATMEVITLAQDNKLKYCYIGDSGFMVIRPYQDQIKQANNQKLYLSIFEYVEQQHGFNFPYQLALPQYGGDSPNNAICGQITVQEKDIIVVGSDGLYDNVSFNQVLQMVRQSKKEGTLLKTLSKKLAQLAIKRGQNPKFDSPFAQRAREQKLSYSGGKLDDTTVIVAQIVAGSADRSEGKNQELL